MSRTTQDLKQRVEAFLSRTGMATSQFGLKACKDKSFVADLRSGNRDFRASTIERVNRFMDTYQIPGSSQPAGGCAASADRVSASR